MAEEEEESEDAEQKQGLHELCRGAFEPLRSAIQSELMLLPACRSLYEDGNCVINGNVIRESVVEHIILDMTGSPAADAGDVSLQRALRRTKRLLTRSNSVLFFRLVIMVLVACMLMFTTLLTWNFTRTFSARSIRNVSLALRHQILLSSLNSIAFVLNQAYTSTLSLSLMHQQALVTHENDTWSTVEDELRGVNWRFLETGKHLQSVAFLSQDGRVTDFTRSVGSEYLYFVQNSTVGMKQRWYSQSVTNSINGHGIERIMQRSVGPFEETFLVNLLERQNVVWSMDIGKLKKQFVSYAVPVINRQTKRFLGMSIVTTTLKDVYHYLGTMDLLGGYLYFFRPNALGNRSLVAISYMHPNDILVSEAAAYLESAYGSQWLLQNETHSEDVSLDGKLFYIDTMPLRNQFKSLELTAVVLLPRTSIMGEMDARSKTIIEVSVGAALGVLVIGFFLICVLTRRMGTEMQLRQELIRQLVAKHKAEQSSNYKTQFLANMSHEMRTPMAGIIGLLDLLACDSLTSDQETSVAQIRQCATGLLALVNNVLDISTVEAGKMELEVSPFNLLEELESLVDMFATQSFGPDVDVTLDLSDDIPPLLKGDAARIRQIFTNLLSNAVKFTDRGHILVRGWADQSLLSLSRKSIGRSFQEAGDGAKVLGIRRSGSSLGTESHRESNKIALAFEIDDTGCGIPTTLRETVFDRFVQADSSTTRSHGGSGLGLYMVRSLVNMMGGDVKVVSKPGPGTCMRFHLILEKPTYSDGEKAGSLERQRVTLLDDSLSVLIASPKRNSEIDTAPALELLAGTHALVALPDGVAKSVLVSWLQRRGLSVTSINNWEDVIPMLSSLCGSSRVEAMSSGPSAPCNTKGTFCVSAESPVSHFTLPSTGSSSCISEIISEASERPGPVLALLDVALASSYLLAACNSGSECGQGNARRNGMNEQKVPMDLQFLQHAFHQLPAKNNLLVAWIAQPNTDPWLKQALLSVTSSVVVKRPLHSSRLKHLLFLLAEARKPEQARSENQSYTSSDPSTPALTGVRGPVKGAGSDYISWNSESDADHVVSTEDECKMPKPLFEKVLPNNPIVNKKKISNSEDSYSCMSPIVTSPKFSFQERGFLRFSAQGHITSEDSPSTPESPTSGLITPEGANSAADGVQEVRKDGICTKELGDVWKGPVIDLKMPSQSNDTFRHVRMPPLLDHRSSLVLSASKSLPTTAPSSPPCRNNAGGLESEVLLGIRILLVEDTPVLQRLISMMLKKLGADVTVVGDGLQAVEAVNRSTVKHVEADGARSQETVSDINFDLILMDCAMPVMDGYGATKAIRESELNTQRHLPIVALTAHALASDEERCLSVGMDAYLTKPINCKQLVSTVKKLVLRNSPDL